MVADLVRDKGVVWETHAELDSSCRRAIVKTAVETFILLLLFVWFHFNAIPDRPDNV